MAADIFLIFLVGATSAYTCDLIKRLHKRVDEIGEQLKMLEKRIIDIQERR
jgi:hypothetical protein